MSAFVHRLRVRYSECDPQGIVFNANYVTYVDVALTELWREAFGSYEQGVAEHGVDLVVGSVTIDFRSSARPDDLIDVGLSLVSIGTTSITSKIEIRREGELLVEGSIRHVCVDATSMAKAAVPDATRAVLTAVYGADA
ncbi:MAG: thioesterase family protein [Aeromicrobium sp.]|uniref:acyl-CoA thioesterase n=1 Tax=Aeromicrobium sp. TaxID=1871063 RepID=UPI0025BB1711|nr:thioesterase family protein [Aeromicrobium sp.]MCK5892706.1 acyl-CoA thioesterase [Aeromicrobium sp.]MDF1703633.1 thioesterase family protein [Aeromicrobium sp.]